MTPLQVEMLVQYLSLTASIIADRFLDLEHHDSQRYQQTVARESLKAFRQIFRNVHLIFPNTAPERLIKPPKGPKLN